MLGAVVHLPALVGAVPLAAEPDGVGGPMYVCMYMHIYIYMAISLSLYIYIYVIGIYIYMYICTYIYVYVCIERERERERQMHCVSVQLCIISLCMYVRVCFVCLVMDGVGGPLLRQLPGGLRGVDSHLSSLMLLLVLV